MYLSRLSARFISAVSIGVFFLSGRALAESAENKFHRAFYLEQSGTDSSGACKLYAELTTDASADAALKAKAQARLASCKEEIAGRDLLSLMPPETLAYVELQRPGDHLLKLLEKLGLLGKDGAVPTKSGRRLAVSPTLIRELLGVGGAAVAVTGFNPLQQAPTGVAVLHPGNLEVVRGLLETALPVAAESVDPIRGHATYRIENKVLVTLTARLVVISSERGPIEGVIRRLTGEESQSLANNPRLVEAAKDRGDSLLFFAIDAKSLMPYVTGMAAASGAGPRELALVQAILDPNSLQSIIGRIGMNDDGAFLNLALRLDKDHRNLVYNFARTAPLNRETLKCIPDGTAAFLVAALNEPTSRYSSTGAAKSEGAAVVTSLDLGREIFANITSMGFFVLPPDGEASGSQIPVPDAAAVISVNDPAKSEAIWRQILGIAGLAAGAPSMDGTNVQIEGREVRAYSFPVGVTVHFATLDNDVLVSLTPSAMTRTIRAKRTGSSVLTDASFTPSLGRLGPDATRAVFVHPGRCAMIAKRFMPAKEVAEIEPFLPMLSNTVASIVLEHSGEMLRVGATLTGIPNVSDLVAGVIEKEIGGGRGNERIAGASKERTVQVRNTEPEKKEIAVVSGKSESTKPVSKDLLTKFKSLAGGKGDRQEALACGEKLFAELRDDAKVLNNLAWELLTESSYQNQFNELALKLAERANELAEFGNWTFLDTLALATFKAGRTEEAVQLQKKAIQLSKGQAAEELKGRLSQFEAALNKRKSGSE